MSKEELEKLEREKYVVERKLRSRQDLGPVKIYAQIYGPVKIYAQIYLQAPAE